MNFWTHGRRSGKCPVPGRTVAQEWQHLLLFEQHQRQQRQQQQNQQQQQIL